VGKISGQFTGLIDALALEAQTGAFSLGEGQRALGGSPDFAPKLPPTGRPYEEIKYNENGTENGMHGAKDGSASNPASPSSPERKKPVEQMDGAGHHEIPVGATTTDLPPGVLYKDRSTYNYVAEDGDELNFEAGEIIHVVIYEDPEEQEEGWLMGVRETTGEKGLFPANFTRPI
jgi:amphiphysin